MDPLDFDDAAIAGSDEDGLGFGEELLGINGRIVDHGLGRDLSQRDHEGSSGTEGFPAAAQIAVDRIETGGLADGFGEVVKIIHGLVLRSGSLKGRFASDSYSIAGKDRHSLKGSPDSRFGLASRSMDSLDERRWRFGGKRSFGS